MIDIPRFRLVNARPSPFGRRIAIALREKGLDYDVIYDVPWGPDTCTPDYSPFQQLPILITPDGDYIYDSTFILEWLEATYPAPPLLPRGVAERLDAKRRQMLGERLMEFAQALVFEHHRPDPSPAWIERQTRKVEGGLAALDADYAKRVIGDETAIDMGDIAVATTMLVIDFIVPAGLSPDLPVFHWRSAAPALAVAVDRLDARPSFAATRPQMMDVNLTATVGT